MRLWQVIALIMATLLLLPVGAALVFGLSALQLHNGIFATLFLVPGTILFAIAALLFWAAFRNHDSLRAMKGGQIVTFIFALVLLLPGSGGLLVGIIFTYSRFSYALLPIALTILGLAACLFWFSLHCKGEARDIEKKA